MYATALHDNYSPVPPARAPLNCQHLHLHPSSTLQVADGLIGLRRQSARQQHGQESAPLQGCLRPGPPARPLRSPLLRRAGPQPPQVRQALPHRRIGALRAPPVRDGEARRAASRRQPRRPHCQVLIEAQALGDWHGVPRSCRILSVADT